MAMWVGCEGGKEGAWALFPSFLFILSYNRWTDGHVYEVCIFCLILACKKGTDIEGGG
jgi:hypothetical protein